jgi:hypothetical protein
MTVRDPARRKALGALALGGAGTLLLAHRAAPAAGAEAAPARIDPADPAARALGYVENAAHVDRAKFPGFVAGSNCENCLQLEGKPGNPYRPCKIFNGKLVAVAGWCTAWTPEI